MEARSTAAEGENESLEPDSEPHVNNSETTKPDSDHYSNSEYSDCDSIKVENSVGSLITDQALEPTNEAQYSTTEPNDEPVNVEARKGPITEYLKPPETALKPKEPTTEPVKSNTTAPSEALEPTPAPLKSTKESQESTTEPLKSTIEVAATSPLSGPEKPVVVESNGGAWRSVAFNLPAAPNTSGQSSCQYSLEIVPKVHL